MSNFDFENVCAVLIAQHDHFDLGGIDPALNRVSISRRPDRQFVIYLDDYCLDGHTNHYAEVKPYPNALSAVLFLISPAGLRAVAEARAAAKQTTEAH